LLVESLQFLDPNPDIVIVFASEIAQNKLTVEGSGPFLKQFSGFRAGEPARRVGSDQTATEVHQQTIA
jgi:hypothetical protein